MGPRAVRITAEDFVIPAEFGGFRLAEHSAGQIGGVHLTLVEQQGRTVFGATYQQVPLRVLPRFISPESVPHSFTCSTRRPACSTAMGT